MLSKYVRDSRKAAWFAIKKGGEVIKEIQLWSPRKKWRSIEQKEVVRAAGEVFDIDFRQEIVL